MRGVRAEDMDVRTNAELLDSPSAPDVLVTQIPYRPAETLDPFEILDFVDDAALRLSADRFAVVLGPASVLVGDLPTGPAARRADLLKADMVEAVIRLPGGCVPYRPGHETALWVMTPAHGSRWSGRVLLANVSDRPLTAAVVRDLAEDVVTWRREGYTPRAHHRVFGVQADVGSLVASLGPLSTSGRPASPRDRKTGADARIALVTQYGVDLDRIGAMASADRRGDGSGTRPAGAVRAAGSLDEQRLLLLPPGQVRTLDNLLASIDERRALAQREVGMLDELRRVATGGLIDGTLTLASDDVLPGSKPSRAATAITVRS